MRIIVDAEAWNTEKKLTNDYKITNASFCSCVLLQGSNFVVTGALQFCIPLLITYQLLQQCTQKILLL